eukprot:scaffold7552_cov47-Phaeocystis_antarctica.AAC.3
MRPAQTSQAPPEPWSPATSTRPNFAGAGHFDPGAAPGHSPNARACRCRWTSAATGRGGWAASGRGPPRRRRPPWIRSSPWLLAGGTRDLEYGYAASLLQ